MDPVAALSYLQGAARRDELLSLGVGLPDLRRAVAEARIFRPAYGTYALARAPRAILAAASLRGQVTCMSACAHWDLRLLVATRRPHVVVPNNRSLDSARLANLGLAVIHHGDIAEGGRRVETVEAAVDHVAWCATPLEQLVALDSALNSRKLDPLGGLTLVTGSLKRREWLVANASRFSQSVPETVARAVLSAAGLQPQVQVRHADVGTVDFCVGTRHCIEVDGWEHHGTKEAFVEDRRRDREMTARRKWTARFPYADVVDDPHGFGVEVARIVHRPVSRRFEARIRWMLSLPNTAFLRR